VNQAQVNASMVREAAQRIKPLARRTPVLNYENIYFKCENLQRGGSFKIRGASNLILSLTPEQAAKGVVAFSSGNHAQAVAIAAKYVGAPATIVMPQDAPKSKMEPTRELGATIVTYDRLKDDREAIAAKLMGESGATLVPPYDHEMVMAGQGTAALELLEEIPDLDAIVTCVGGGGMTAGCAVIAKSIDPRIRIFGAEPELANDTFLSFQAGKRIEIPPPETIADGLRSPAPGKLTFPILQELVEAILLVSEDDLRAAMRFFLSKMKLVVEPSGGASTAAVMAGKLPPGIGKVGVIVSGGNIDLAL
jgi:threonine dehydratase